MCWVLSPMSSWSFGAHGAPRATGVPPGVSLPSPANSPVARSSPVAPGEHLAHLPFLGPQLLLKLFEIVKISWLVNRSFYAL